MPAHVENHDVVQAPITLPPIAWLRRPELIEIAEPGERITELRTIRQGVEAWARVGSRATFDDWAALGKALLIGRTHALAVSGAAKPIGRR
jgi:hypothetical protein